MIQLTKENIIIFTPHKCGSSTLNHIFTERPNSCGTVIHGPQLGLPHIEKHTNVLPSTVQLNPQYWTIAIGVRNPYTRALSIYNHYLRFDPPDEDINSFAEFVKYRLLTGGHYFSQTLYQFCKRISVPLPHAIRTQQFWPSRIIHVETIKEDIKALGFEFETLPIRNKTPFQSFATMDDYTPETIALVGIWGEMDFTCFGYYHDFDKCHLVKEKTNNELIDCEKDTDTLEDKMIILITSCSNNNEYREALRQTWLKDVDCPYMFLVGDAKQVDLVDDILQLTIDDGYNFVQEKQFEAFKYCLKKFEFNHIFICDDDAYVRMDRLLDSDYHLHDYYGGGPVRTWDRPYYACGGPGIVLSRKAVQAIVDNGEKHLHSSIAPMVAVCNQTYEDQYWADRFIGMTLDYIGIKPFYDERFVDVNFDPLAGVPKQYNNIISYHGKLNVPMTDVRPEQIIEIHQHFQKPLKPVKVAMVLDQWSKGGAEKEFADMIIDADPTKIQYVGIALNIAYEFYLRDDLKGKLPPFHTHKEKGYDAAINKEYLTLHDNFEGAIVAATKNADVIIKWHTSNTFLERINKPSILLSNATAWYTEFKYQKVFADKYVGNSKWSTNWLPKHAKDRLVIYSGHSEDRIKTKKGRDQFRENAGFNENDKVVAHIGRVNLDKNLKILAKAVSLLPENWKLMLVGRIPIFYKEKLLELLEAHLPNRYKLISWVDHVGDAFAASDVFALTSFYEGFSNALAEAWMSKTPTVFSSCGAADELMEMYGNIGINVKTNSTPTEISNSILKAQENTKGITNAYNMIKTFTREKSARNWERCIIETCYGKDNYNKSMLEFDPYFEIFELMKEYKTTKRVARRLNIDKFPLPEGEKEWTYLLVQKYID